MQPIHAQIAEPTVLAVARPQDGVGVMAVSIGVGRSGRDAAAAPAFALVPAVARACRMGAWSPPTADSPAWTTSPSFRSRPRKPHTGDGTLHIGGGLHDRIEVRPA